MKDQEIIEIATKSLTMFDKQEPINLCLALSLSLKLANFTRGKRDERHNRSTGRKGGKKRILR